MTPEQGKALEKLLANPGAVEVVQQMAGAVQWGYHGRPRYQEVLEAYHEEVTGIRKPYTAVTADFLKTSQGRSLAWMLAEAVRDARGGCTGLGCDGRCVRNVLDEFFGVKNLGMASSTK